jgi:hypothetical protein
LEWFTILSTLAPKAKRLIWIYFAAQCWSLWTVLNKFTIEEKFPRQPADCVFKTILSLQLWRQLQNVKDRVLLDELIFLARTFFASTYSPPSPQRSLSRWLVFALPLSSSSLRAVVYVVANLATVI